MAWHKIKISVETQSYSTRLFNC